MKYIQCKLVRPVKKGKVVQVAFIPDNLAKQKKSVSIEDVYWEVAEVYKDSAMKMEDINRTKEWKEQEIAGRKSYKAKN